MDWRDIKFEHVRIEKYVAEFRIWESDYNSLGAYFNLKIYERSDGVFEGYTDIEIKNSVGDFYCAVGSGKSIEEALQKTIQCYFDYVSCKKPEEWKKEDFKFMEE